MSVEPREGKHVAMEVWHVVRRCWIQNEVQLGNAFSRIHIHRAHIRIVAHDFLHTAGDFPKFCGIRPHHPKSIGKGRVGTNYQLRRPNPRFRRQAIGGRFGAGAI